MLLAGSMTKMWCHCIFRREMHDPPLQSRNFSRNV